MFSCDSVVLCILSCLVIVYMSLGGITKGSRRMRLLGKFVENECEKIDRLMEFYTRYICCGERGLPYFWQLLHLLIAWSLVLYRYSDRVKEETERLDSLDLEDLEVPFYALFL